jgi:hypothetical protein
MTPWHLGSDLNLRDTFIYKLIMAGQQPFHAE